MAIILTKGSNISLSKTVPGLQKVLIGLGWDARATLGVEFDLDATAFLLNGSGKVNSDRDFVYYNNKISPCGSVSCGEDNRSGDGDGDDETVSVTLPSVPHDTQKIAICVSIHEAAARRQTFGMVQNAFIRVVDVSTGTEIVRFDLSEDFGGETAAIFGELYRYNGEWKFKAVGQGFGGGIEALLAHFGLSA